MLKRGWCPGLYDPMPTGDGLLVRVKPPRARLTPRAALALADAAAAFGNGIIELTQRGNLQIRGLRPDTATRFAAAMAGAGLAHPDPAQEARRAVMPPPLLGLDPALAANAGALTDALEAAFADDPRLANLPAKFAVSIDAGGVLGGLPVAADLVAWTDGGKTELRPARRGVSPAPVGPLPYDETVAAFGFAPPLGQLDAAMLRRLAALAGGHGTDLRVTPWRALLLGRVCRADAARIAAAAGEAWITDPADRRLLVTACIGQPGCASATVPARGDAGLLRPAVPVHVSGCAKGCAHPGPAARVLVGREGRYDLVRDGRAKDAPDLAGLSFAEAAALLVFRSKHSSY